MRPGGHVVIDDVSHELVFRGSVVKALGPNGEPGLAPAHRHTPGDFLRAALAAGLQVRRCEEPGSGRRARRHHRHPRRSSSARRGELPVDPAPLDPRRRTGGVGDLAADHLGLRAQLDVPLANTPIGAIALACATAIGATRSSLPADRHHAVNGGAGTCARRRGKARRARCSVLARASTDAHALLRCRDSLDRQPNHSSGMSRVKETCRNEPVARARTRTV